MIDTASVFAVPLSHSPPLSAQPKRLTFLAPPVPPHILSRGSGSAVKSHFSRLKLCSLRLALTLFHAHPTCLLSAVLFFHPYLSLFTLTRRHAALPDLDDRTSYTLHTIRITTLTITAASSTTTIIYSFNHTSARYLTQRASLSLTLHPQHLG